MSSTTITARACDCYRPRPQREAERLELQCFLCKRLIEIAPGDTRCPYCAITLKIEAAEVATA